jgi:LmbE family N-acetylglucosaminyl deacetylase
MKSVDDHSRPLKVFLCHAHPDAEKVRALYARLKADGVETFVSGLSHGITDWNGRVPLLSVIP